MTRPIVLGLLFAASTAGLLGLGVAILVYRFAMGVFTEVPRAVS